MSTTAGYWHSSAPYYSPVCESIFSDSPTATPISVSLLTSFPYYSPLVIVECACLPLCFLNLRPGLASTVPQNHRRIIRLFVASRHLPSSVTIFCILIPIAKEVANELKNYVRNQHNPG